MIYNKIENTIDGVRNFKWKDALYLREWGIYCFPTRDQELEIIKIAFKMQQIYDFFGLPIQITSWLRPKPYNVMIKGAEDSPHLYGMAVDFNVETISADTVRSMLLPHLDEFKIRMEDRPKSNWVHCDNREPVNKRFFKP